jgi:hypothetical protein
VIRALLAAALAASAVALAAGTAETEALLEGTMPDDPGKPLVQGKCLLCHSADYLTQQRLTAGQWEKTVEKMRKFGTPANDEEAKLMTAYLARYWTQDLPPPRPVRAPAPRK